MPVTHVKNSAEFTALLSTDKAVIVGKHCHDSVPSNVSLTPFCLAFVMMFRSDRLVSHLISDEFTNLVFLKVDVDECSEAAESAGITAMPTFHVYKAGKKVAEMMGANPAKLKELVANANN
ncbi:Cytoplasmic thioredoxin isoenzyme 2 [Podochytrium sp. JEL0797]|nr:Cytoplasmic thioredoxin isoenzyme 2 [Podochytrium sp. JEL0797]